MNQPEAEMPLQARRRVVLLDPEEAEEVRALAGVANRPELEGPVLAVAALRRWAADEGQAAREARRRDSRSVGGARDAVWPVVFRIGGIGAPTAHCDGVAVETVDVNDVGIPPRRLVMVVARHQENQAPVEYLARRQWFEGLNGRRGSLTVDAACCAYYETDLEGGAAVLLDGWLRREKLRGLLAASSADLVTIPEDQLVAMHALWSDVICVRTQIACRLFRTALIVHVLGTALRGQRRQMPRGPEEERFVWSEVVTLRGVEFAVELTSSQKEPRTCRMKIWPRALEPAQAADYCLELRREGAAVAEKRYLGEAHAEYSGLTAGRHVLALFEGDTKLAEIELPIEDCLESKPPNGDRPPPRVRGACLARV